MKRILFVALLTLLPTMLMAQRQGGEVKRPQKSQKSVRQKSPWEAYVGRKLYLVAYGRADFPYICTFGEYILLGKDGTLSWCSRAEGNDTYYKYHISGKRVVFNETYFEIVKTQGSNILLYGGDDVNRMYSTSPQRVIKGDGADIQKFYIEHNVVRNGERGLVAHVDVKTVNALGHDLRLSVYFDSPENIGLVDANGRYAGANNVVCTETRLTNDNRYNPCWWMDTQLFLPYSELHVTSQGVVDIAAHAYVHDTTLGGNDRMYWLTKTDFLHFSYDSSSQSAYNTGKAMTGSAVSYIRILGAQ